MHLKELRRGTVTGQTSQPDAPSSWHGVGTPGHEARGEWVLFQDDEDRLPRLLASCVIMLLILTAGMFHYLPREVAMIVASWATLSISVGISFGHCVLNEP